MSYCYRDSTNLLIIGDKKYAWGSVGTSTAISQSLRRSKRWNVLPAFTIDGYIACEIHQGSITAPIFKDFVKNQVLPLCSPIGGKNSVIALDNAKIHWNKELVELCQEHGVELARLPPYSPDITLSRPYLLSCRRGSGGTSLCCSIFLIVITDLDSPYALLSILQE